jgi:hypothetical protein
MPTVDELRRNVVAAAAMIAAITIGAFVVHYLFIVD